MKELHIFDNHTHWHLRQALSTAELGRILGLLPALQVVTLASMDVALDDAVAPKNGRPLALAKLSVSHVRFLVPKGPSNAYADKDGTRVFLALLEVFSTIDALSLDWPYIYLGDGRREDEEQEGANFDSLPPITTRLRVKKLTLRSELSSLVSRVLQHVLQVEDIRILRLQSCNPPAGDGSMQRVLDSFAIGAREIRILIPYDAMRFRSTSEYADNHDSKLNGSVVGWNLSQLSNLERLKVDFFINEWETNEPKVQLLATILATLPPQLQSLKLQGSLFIPEPTGDAMVSVSDVIPELRAVAEHIDTLAASIENVKCVILVGYDEYYAEENDVTVDKQQAKKAFETGFPKLMKKGALSVVVSGMSRSEDGDGEEDRASSVDSVIY